jgi:hypothetical protein
MPDEKKLIIDEDWKAQVEAEKHEASPTHSAQPKSAAAAAATQPADPPMPPASFEMLLTTLATEALIALGQVPHPATGRAEAHRNQAQYLIDTIEVLQQKTNGNLTPDEAQMIETLLHQLRMAFIDTAIH